MIVRKVAEGLLRRFQSVFYLYIVIQTCLAKYQLNCWSKILLQIFLTTILSAVQISLLLAIELFRQIIKCFLYVFVKDFDGLLRGPDSVWAKVSDTKSKCSPAALVLIEHDDPKELQEEIKQRYSDMFVTKLYQRAYNKIDSFCGFYYYTKTHNINVNDHVVKLDFYDSKDGFEDALGNIINEDFPVENKSMWRVYVGQQPISWVMTSRSLYPVLFRMHHSMGDGIALLNLFVDIFVDDGNTVIKNIYKEMNNKIIRSSNSDKCTNSKLQSLIKKIPSLRFKALELKPPSKYEHFLYGKTLSGKKMVSFLSEDKPNLVEKVKNIKKKLNVSFTDVVNAAISASFAEYIKNKYRGSQDLVPEFLSATMVVVLGAMDLAKEVSNVQGRLKVTLNNKFTSGKMQLPIRKFLDSRGKNFESHIMDINRESLILRNSIDLAYNEWQLNIPTPACITRYITNCSLGALIISSLPGCGRLTVLNGHDVHDMAFWIPNMLQSGIGVSIQSYDGRFQVGLLVDQVLIGDRRDLKAILEGVFKYLELFYEEIFRDHNNKDWDLLKHNIV